MPLDQPGGGAPGRLICRPARRKLDQARGETGQQGRSQTSMANLDAATVTPAAQEPASDDLAQRIQRLEDERTILQLIDLHGMLSDAGPAEGFAELYAEDCFVDLGELMVPGTKTVIAGRDRLLAQIYLDPDHRAAEGRTQHLRAGPQIIHIDGDDAAAVTYAVTTFLQAERTAKIIVTGFNFWTLARIARRWRFTRRVARRLGDDDVLALFRPLVARALG
jgi:hypothetical protein